MQEVQTIEMEQTETSEKNAGNGAGNNANSTEGTLKPDNHGSDTSQALDSRGRKRHEGQFKVGNTAWKGTDSELLSAAQKRRHIIRAAMLEAVTPAKARQCVKRMLEIINAKGIGADKKAAVGAFKVLFDLLGAKAVDVDAQGPRGFVFILPAAGTIPDVRRIVDNESCPPVDQPHSL